MSDDWKGEPEDAEMEGPAETSAGADAAYRDEVDDLLSDDEEAPEDLRRKIAEECSFVIEALAD